MQDTGDELAIKRTTTANNLMCVCICIYTYIYIYRERERETPISKLQDNYKSKIYNWYTQVRKINSNAILKIVMKPQEERTSEERKKKEQQKQIQSN